MDEKKLFKIRDETSNTFCLAKFHEASIWVYSGKIASCHYTPFIQVGNTVDTFYNPAEKREQQKRKPQDKSSFKQQISASAFLLHQQQAPGPVH